MENEIKTNTAALLPSGSAPSHSVGALLGHLRAGGLLYVPSNSRWLVLDGKTLTKFEKAGAWLLREDGNGYRIRQGNGSVYVFAGEFGQLKIGKAA